MIKIIVSGHGNISLGMLDAFTMIFGKDPEIKAIPFLKGEGLPQLQKKFQEEIDSLSEEDELLFLVDVFGGTPYNAAAQLIFPLQQADILTGVNLPMLLEAATNKSMMQLEELVKYLKETSSDSVKIFKEEIKNINQTDQEEDLL